MTIDKSKITTDFLVIGGGTGGISAAIEASRNNINTILIAENNWLGGMLTAAGVSCIDGNYNMKAGLFGEFATAIFDYYGGSEEVKTGWVSHINYEPSVANKIIHKMTENLPGLRILKNCRFKSLSINNSSIKSVIITDESGNEFEINAKIYMDATEYGDVGMQAGCTYNMGLSESGKDANIQDITWVAILQEFDNGVKHLLQKPDSYNANDFLGCCKEWSNDEFPSDLPAEKMLTYGKLPNNKYMINWPNRGNDFFTNVLELDQDNREKEWAKAREFTRCMVYFIQNQLGYKNLGLATEFPTEHGLAIIPYNRESRRFNGYTKIDVDHIINPYGSDNYKTGIAVGDYPIDHHHSRNSKEINENFPSVPSFNVPFGVIVSRDVDNLLFGEKNISASHIVNGSTRLQPVVMQLGQAAGATAALSIQNNCNIKSLNIRELQQRILEFGSYIMPIFDVDKQSECFQVVQRICAVGMMRIYGVPHEWANRSYFYPQDFVTATDIRFLLENYFSVENAIIADDKNEEGLSGAEIKMIMIENGITFPLLEDYLEETIKRIDFAILLDNHFKPFDKEIFLMK